MDEQEQNTGRTSFWLKIAAAALAILCIVQFLHVQELEKALDDNARMAELQAYVAKNYYQEPDEEAAMNGALKGYVAGLNDPYSSFLTNDEYGDWQEKESGTSVGIGITVQYDETLGMPVILVEAESPAEKSGIQVDDVIIAVNGMKVTEIGYEAAVAAVKGEIGTAAELTILRDGKELVLSVMREQLIKTTAHGQMLAGDVGYIHIAAFRENTDEQFLKTLETLLNAGAKSLLFDVRDNGGGLLSALEDTLDTLLPKGVIAVANYGDGTERIIVESDAHEIDLPMAVLVNGGTASAGELFSASLHDFDKAFLVGTTTYGKGVMQDTKQVSGGAVTLTVATYQTVKGECYHGIGITPDYEVEPTEGFVIDFDNPNLEEDLQLMEAYERLTESS